MKLKEVKRLISLSSYEDDLFLNGYRRIAGVDEVGRGSLAGPLVVAGVILKKEVNGLNDSSVLGRGG